MLKFLDELAFKGVALNSLKSQSKELAKVLLNEKIISKHDGLLHLNNGYVYGKLMSNSHGSGFLKPPVFMHKFSMQDIKIRACDLASGKRGDLVIAKLLGYKNSRAYAKVVLVCERALSAGVVELVRIKGNYFGKCFRTGLCMQLNASQKSLAMLPQGTILAVEYGEKNEITEVLGHINDPAIDEKISLKIYNKQEEFDEASLQAARANCTAVDASMYERLDLRHLPFCTIDPVHAKDFDDAVYYDETDRSLWVMIADVSEYVSAFSALDRSAYKRAFSVYFPHKCVPMLPKELSENACSLNPNEDKLAFGFCLKYSPNFELLSASLHEAIICSKRRFNYDEVDEFLQTHQDLGEFNYIHSLNDFAKNSRKKRLKLGYDFHTATLCLNLKDNLLQNTYYEYSSPSHQLIEECMLEANKAAAALLEHKKGVYRNHTAPNLSKINQMFSELELMGVKFKLGKNLHESIINAQEIADEMGLREEIDKIIIRSFKKADYGSECFGHYALGFDSYTHFTSPIRRYSDLILHRLLKANLAQNQGLFDFYAADLDEKCAYLSSLEKDAEKVAKDFANRKFCRWALNNLGKTFSAQVLADDDALSARLIESEASGALVQIVSSRLQPFSKIIVQITDAHLHSGLIFARFIKHLRD